MYFPVHTYICSLLLHTTVNDRAEVVVQLHRLLPDDEGPGVQLVTTTPAPALSKCSADLSPSLLVAMPLVFLQTKRHNFQ